jgi:predicted phosphodiesterase
MRSVMLAGDPHGAVRYIRALAEEAARYECKTLFLLGDVNVGYRGDELLLDNMQSIAEANDVVIYCLDGNHDSLDRFMSFTEEDEEGFRILRPRVRFAPRGHRWTWNGVTFLSCGGAYSIDKEWSIQEMKDHEEMMSKMLDPPRDGDRRYELWWATELITDEDIEACGTEPVDIVLSHDTPSGVNMVAHMAARGRGYATIGDAEANRIQLRRICDNVHPRYIYHGHYHLKYVEYMDFGYGDVEVRGLGSNHNPTEAYMFLDLVRLEDRLNE